MRTIHKEDIQLIDILTAKDFDDSDLFANRISSLFIKEEKTLLLDLDNEEYFLFSNKADKDIPIIVSILSLLEYFEREGYIYVISTTEKNEALFVCDGVNACNVAINNPGSSYSYINDSKIEKKNNFWIVNGRKMNVTVLSSFLGKRIVHFFSSKIYSTPALLELKVNNYKTVARRQFEKELFYARSSFAVALVALLFTVVFSIASIPCTTDYTNNHSYTTIEQNQYTSLIQKIDSIISIESSRINKKRGR